MSLAMLATFQARESVISWWLAGSYETLPVIASFSSPPMRCSRPGGAGDGPGAGEGVEVPHVGEEGAVGPVGVLGELDVDRRGGHSRRAASKAPIRWRRGCREAAGPGSCT